MSGTAFKLLREGLHLIPADLKVPEVVVDEVVNRFREDLEKARVGAAKAEAALGRLLPEPLQQPSKSIDVAHQTEEYRKWLVSALQDFSAETLPYPEVPHKKIVERDLQRRSPFKRNGAGYRDSLIWENVRGLTFGGHERVVLVTANKRDFGESPRVADDLQGELLNPDRLELVLSLKSLNDKFIVPRLNMAEDIKSRLQSEASSSFDIPRWLRESLLDRLRDDELGPFIGIPDQIRVWPSEIVAFEKISVEEVLRLPEGEILVRAGVRVEVHFSVDVDWDDFVSSQEVRDWVGDESERFSWMSTDQVDQLEFGLNFVLDRQGERLVDSEIRSIDGPCASAEMGSW